ncbi:Leucine-rich repeat, plant specific [Heracleum sosnowskyi]|uniref:Leucine-rich repeat, plant specific n=1 Tax=Heracleum sosnowskyi TaxID=360622 RepID=A0AAD8JNJ9_9APIA|nr:Leucine-rich repeat, plant specific [Heracleum sosnowskyi]
MSRFLTRLVYLTFTIILGLLIFACVNTAGASLPLISGHTPQLVAPVVAALAPVVEQVEQLVFVDLKLSIVYPVIQNFKKIITSDPLGITKSWVGSDICKYKGFYCDNPPYNTSAITLASIDFNGFQLSAPSLDGFLDLLPDIALFHANSNFFTGTISSNIANLPFLYELDISNNLFSGPFPTAILGMSSLSFLDIRFNMFTGSVPPQLFMKDLDALFINNNDFMQRLPDNLGGSHIILLTLANNKFFGPIPRDIAKALSSITEVLFLNNKLSGCLPYELGFLKEAVVFDAGNNQLSGPIPYSLGCLESVEVLNFAGNMFSGPICRSLITKGVLDVRRNCIPGLPFQRSILECAAFFSRSRHCPYYASYFYIPCWLPNFSSPPLATLLAPSPT